MRHVDEHAQARHLGHQRTQRRDDFLRRLRALIERLEIDVDVAAVAEHEVRQTVDARVAADNLGDLLLLAHHVVEADALDRFGRHVDAPDVLVGQEPFRNEREQVRGRTDEHDRDRHRHGVKAEALAQRDVVELRQQRGLTFQQIADRLHRPLGTVLTQMRAALARISAALENYR